MSSPEEALRTMAGLDAARRAAWAEVFKLRRRVAELEAQLGSTRTSNPPEPLIKRTIADGRYEVEAIADGHNTGVFIQHVASGRVLQLNVEPTPENADVMYGALWIAEGIGPDDEQTFIWDSEVRLASAERIEGGWESPSDMSGSPGLRGDGDWGRQVELCGATRDETSFIGPSTRTTTFLEWGRRDGIPFVEVVNVPPLTEEMVSARLEFVDGAWSIRRSTNEEG